MAYQDFNEISSVQIPLNHFRRKKKLKEKMSLFNFDENDSQEIKETGHKRPLTSIIASMNIDYSKSSF